MASLATCPLCAKQLAVPKEAAADDRAQCPECDATFLLGNAFQVALPVLRLLAPEDPAPEETPTEEVATVESHSLSDFSPASETKSSIEEPPTPNSNTTEVESLSSWEARLKKAIERDTSEIADQIETPEPPAEPTIDSAPEPATFAPRPEFNFQLDPTPAEMPRESEIESAKKTAQADLRAAENAQSFAEELDVPEKVETATVAAFTKKPELRLGAASARPRRSFSPLKAVAVLIGPGAVGIFLGLYALLWIKGPSGDLMNVAQYLPASMLPYAESAEEMPASGGPTNEMNISNEITQQLADTPPQEDPSELLASSPPAAEPEPQPEPPRRDQTVQLAAAEEPLPQATTSLPAFFGELLAAAQSAQPGLIEGDLSNNAAVARKGQAYMAVCRLAQEFEWIRQPNLDVSSQAQITAALEVFDRAVADQSALRDLASIVSRWWGYEARPNQGIFLVGQIRNIQSLGGQTLCDVALDEPASATVIPVLLDQPPVQGASRILVVGKIVAQPSIQQKDSNLQDFTIDLPQVVVAPYSRVLQP